MVTTTSERTTSRLTRDRLKEIGRFSAENCFTFTVLTEPERPEAYEKGRIRFKNLLACAQAALAQDGWTPPEIEQFFEPIADLQENRRFWAEQSQTLMIYHAAAFSEQFRLPYTLAKPRVDHNTRFNIRPLLPYFFKNHHFYILQLSQNQVHLYEANRHHIQLLEADDIPGSLDEALRYDDPEARLFVHNKGDATTFHGHHPKDEEAKTLHRFFNLVDKAVCRYIGDSGAPLLLAAVEHYLPIYQVVTDYPNLVDGIVAGNFDTVWAEKLHTAAWPIMSDYFDEARASVLQRLEFGRKSDLTTTEWQTIVPAAYYGQIDTLLLPQDQTIYGFFDPHTDTVERAAEGEESVELLDLAATHVLLQGGEIYAAEKLAALLRSPARWPAHEAPLNQAPAH